MSIKGGKKQTKKILKKAKTKKKTHPHRIKSVIRDGFGCCEIFNLNDTICDLIEVGCYQFAKQNNLSWDSNKFKNILDWNNYIRDIAHDLKKYREVRCGTKFTSIKHELRSMKKAQGALRRFARIVPS